MRSTGFVLQFAFTIMVVLRLTPIANGEDAGDGQAWFPMMVRQAESYEFTTPSDEWIISRSEKPVFRHDSPSRNSDDIGGVWVWTDQHQRPVAVGTVFGWTSAPGTRTVLHEFCSLSRVEFQAVWKHDERSDTWRPREPVHWKPIPNASTPSTNIAKLKLQMRREARRFGAHTYDRSQKRWDLRLIPSPVYDYQSRDSELTLGGAVFVICQDTNTDVVLGIEAVRDQIGGAYRFEYALGSFTDWDLHVELDGDEIWTENANDSRGSEDLHWVRLTGRIRLRDE